MCSQKTQRSSMNQQIILRSNAIPAGWEPQDPESSNTLIWIDKEKENHHHQESRKYKIRIIVLFSGSTCQINESMQKDLEHHRICHFKEKYMIEKGFCSCFPIPVWKQCILVTKELAHWFKKFVRGSNISSKLRSFCRLLSISLVNMIVLSNLPALLLL